MDCDQNTFPCLHPPRLPQLLNSWGPYWGEGGFFRIRRNAYSSTAPNGAFGLCGVASMLARVLVTPTNSSLSPPPFPPPRPRPPMPPSPPDVSGFLPGYTTVSCGSPSATVVYMVGCSQFPALCGAYFLTNRTCNPAGSTLRPPVYAMRTIPAAYASTPPELWFATFTWLIGPRQSECMTTGLSLPYYINAGLPSSDPVVMDTFSFTGNAKAICARQNTPTSG